MNFRFKSLYISFLRFRKTFNDYPFRKFNVFEILLFWVKDKLTRSQFLVLAGILVGLTAGSAAVLLKMLVHYIQYFIHNDVPFAERMFVYGVFPLLGILLTALIVRFLFKSDNDKELSFVLKDISQNDSKIKSNKMYSQIIQSAVTVGFGGSAGLESPIAVTGSAIGSNFAQRYRLGFKERTLLLAAGAAAGISAAFNAPIAGVMFAFEVLLTGLVFTDFIPLVIASICGSLISKMLLDEEALFILNAREAFNYINIVYYVGIGLLSGLYARYFLITGQRVHTYFERFKNKYIVKALVGGSILSILCVAFPPLFGEGYINIRILHNGQLERLIQESFFQYFNPSQWLVIAFLASTVLLKAFATSITLNSGGNGGNFAPSLISGGMLGFLYAYVLKALGFSDVPMTNLMLVGMAGVLSGAMYAPLTAIFLIAECSTGYDLFIPLMTASVMSYAINRYFSKINPVYKGLADEGKIFTTRQDQNILSHIKIEDCMNPDTIILRRDEDMEEVLFKFRNSDEICMAVVDNDNKFWGVLNRVQMRPFLMGKQALDTSNLSKLTVDAAFEISTGDSVMKIIKMFDEADVWFLPLLDQDRFFLGFVSRSLILNNYRSLLKAYSE